MLKPGDFIRIEYTGKDESGNVFDATRGKVAKTLHNKEGAMLIVYGKDKLILGLDEALKDMKKGDKKELSFSPEKAFGFRTRDLVRTMPEKDFHKSEIMPQAGLMVTLDMDQGRLNGVIKSVSGGRVLVDFNHPLADKKVHYSIELTDVVIEPHDKIKALMEDMALEGSSELHGEKLVLHLNKKSKDYIQKKDFFVALVKELLPPIKEIEIKETA